MLSAKWTAATFFALTALGAGSLAFAGCTVTSGTITDKEGGSGLPPEDSGTGSETGGDTGTADAGSDTGTTNACPSNTKQTVTIVGPACQSALESECCSQLAACFNITVATPKIDCNGFVDCIFGCGEDQTCQQGCVDGTTADVVSAYDALAQCQDTQPTTKTACVGK